MKRDGKQRGNVRQWWVVGTIVVVIAVIAFITAVSRHKTAVVVATPVPSGTGLPKATAVVPSVSPTTPTPAPTAASSRDGSISITAPGSGATVTSGTIVSGVATAGETVYLRLKGGNSGQLFYGSTTAGADGIYHLELAFTNQVKGGTDSGALEAFTLSSAGAETNPVTLEVGISG